MPPAPNRIEATTEPEEPSAEVASSAPASRAAKGSLQAWLPLGVTLLVMPALAYAMTTFVLLPRLQKGLGVSGASAAATDSGGDHKSSGPGLAKKESVTMNKLLVNVAGTMGSRYLLVSLSVVGNDPEFKRSEER